MYAEIKYDGERVQLHKNGSEFQYFSRSLKPVLPHKVMKFINVNLLQCAIIQDIDGLSERINVVCWNNSMGK